MQLRCYRTIQSYFNISDKISLMCAAINIVTFKRTERFKLPNKYEHWGLFVRYEDESERLYHADKTSITNTQTKYETKQWSPNRSKKVDLIVLVGYSSASFTDAEMVKICDNITQDRVFNTLTNNCQEWVKSVLDRLVEQRFLANANYELLKEGNDITPLLGWGKR